MKKIIVGLVLLIFNYSCVSNAEGNSIKRDIAKIDVKYKMLENQINEDQNKFNRKLRSVDVKLLELDKILKEARTLLHRNNADFGQDIVKMDIRLKNSEGKSEEILFKFGQLEKKFQELKEKISDFNGGVAISNSANKDVKEDDSKSDNSKSDVKEDSKIANTDNNTETDFKKINNPIALFKLGYSYIDGKNYKSMAHKERMSKAIEVFEYLIQKFPDHKNSNSARYWITQAYYSSTQYENAYRAMSKFLEKYPKSRHIPQILFQMGNSLKELGLKKDSKTIFNTLIKLYPKSGYSKKAKLFLKTL